MMSRETVTENLRFCQRFKIPAFFRNCLMMPVLVSVCLHFASFHVEGKENDCYYHDIGYYYFDIGEYELAIKYFEKAIELARESAEKSTNLPPQYVLNKGIACLKLGYSLKAGGKMRDAEKFVKQGHFIVEYAVKKDAGLTKIAANWYYELKDYKTALVYFDKAVAGKRNDPQTLYLRGRTYFELKRYEEAKNDFLNAGHLREDANDYHYLGKICFETNGYAECETYYQTANRLVASKKYKGADIGGGYSTPFGG